METCVYNWSHFQLKITGRLQKKNIKTNKKCHTNIHMYVYLFTENKNNNPTSAQQLAAQQNFNNFQFNSVQLNPIEFAESQRQLSTTSK